MDFRIGLVGPCGAGKSTLAKALNSMGYHARHIAQEHSYVPYMWQRIARPDVLVYLEVSYENTLNRRRLNWTETEYQEQVRRLRHARQHANLFIDTNPLTPDEVLKEILEFLESK